MRRAGAWLLLIVGLAGLIALRVAYNATYEPAPGIRVRWRDGTSDMRRAFLEMTYRLTDAAAPEGLSYSYVLLDTSRRNIEAMIKDPEVADTGDLDREKFEVPFATAQYSRQWMWVADRTPGLRQPLLRWALIVALAGCIVAGGYRLADTYTRRARD